MDSANTIRAPLITKYILVCGSIGEVLQLSVFETSTCIPYLKGMILLCSLPYLLSREPWECRYPFMIK